MNTPPEEWRLIADWPYEISNLGNVRHAISKRPRKLKMQSRYLAFTARRPRVPGQAHIVVVYVHRAMCEAFVGPHPGEGYEVCHNDGDRLNNAPSNLRWGTRADNARDRFAHGTVLLGERHQNAVLTEAMVRKIREMRAKKSGSLTQIARSIGVHESTVKNVVYGTAWSHLT